MKSNMAIHHFRHQTIERPTSGGNQLKQIPAFVFLLNRLLNRIDLSANSPDSIQKLYLVLVHVSHTHTLSVP